MAIALSTKQVEQITAALNNGEGFGLPEIQGLLLYSAKPILKPVGPQRGQ